MSDELERIKVQLPPLGEHLQSARAMLNSSRRSNPSEQGVTNALLRTGVDVLSEEFLGQPSIGRYLWSQVAASSAQKEKDILAINEDEARRIGRDVAATLEGLLGDPVPGVEPRTQRKWKQRLHKLHASPPSRTMTLLKGVEETIAELNAYEARPTNYGRTQTKRSITTPPGRATGSPPRTPGLHARLSDELAKVFHDREQAMMLVKQATFPPEAIPDFRTPNAFWVTVVDEAAKGRIHGGIRPIIEHAMRAYPGNQVFADALRMLELEREGR